MLETIKIENMIYIIRGKQVIFDFEICYGYLYDKIITRYDIGKPISMLINFADTSAKLKRSYHND